MSELISRQAVLDAIRGLYIAQPKINNDYAYDMALDKADDAIRALPSVQPDIIRCKDCKYSHDEYGDGDCYCKIPGKELYWLGQRWDFYCADAKPKEET